VTIFPPLNGIFCFFSEAASKLDPVAAAVFYWGGEAWFGFHFKVGNFQ